MDMQDDVYYDYLAESVREGTISEDLIDESVRNILGLKYDLGLFEDPYRYLDQEREDSIIYHEELMEHALVSARKSIVLLENKPFKGEKLLPVKKEVKEIALIGPLATAKESMMGCWKAAGDDSKVVSVLEGLKTEFSNSTIHFSKGCEIEEMDRSGFDKAVNLAKSSDLVIMALGEHWLQSGEASSRARIGLPGVQEELVRKIKETGKPIVVVLMAGRPLAVPWIAENIPAVVNAWHLGTRAGDAIADVLSGVYNPSGKLTVTFPRDEGQIPIYYSHKNTGRPFKPDDKYTTKYLDMPVEPLYPFGFGLSYTEFNYSNLTLDKKQIKPDEVLAISVKVKNTGGYEGEEIVQLYTRDIVGSVTRPVKELKAFRKIKLKPGEEKVVDFQISSDDLKFYDIDMNFVAEPGDFKVFVGKSSREVLEAEFSLVK
jgi:beta-glucosidase